MPKIEEDIITKLRESLMKISEEMIGKYFGSDECFLKCMTPEKIEFILIIICKAHISSLLGLQIHILEKVVKDFEKDKHEIIDELKDAIKRCLDKMMISVNRIH